MYQGDHLQLVGTNIPCLQSPNPLLDWTIHEYLLHRPTLSSGEAFLVRPPRRTASTPAPASRARSPDGLRSRTPRDDIPE